MLYQKMALFTILILSVFVGCFRNTILHEYSDEDIEGQLPVSLPQVNDYTFNKGDIVDITLPQATDGYGEYQYYISHGFEGFTFYPQTRKLSGTWEFSKEDDIRGFVNLIFGYNASDEDSRATDEVNDASAIFVITFFAEK